MTLKTVCCFCAMLILVLISVKPEGDQFKIPNQEVMDDWAQWIVDTVGGDLGANKDIAKECVKGPVNSFQQKWPDFMQHQLHLKSVTKGRGAKSLKTAERIYQLFLLGLMLGLQLKGWEVNIKEQAGEGYLNISKSLKIAVLIELKSSEKPEHVQKDAKVALKQN